MAAGRPDITVKQFNHADYPQKSVISSIAGTGKLDESIVLGAHLDAILVSKMSETAQASGVASLTEALRALLAQNFKPARGMHFIAHAAEEVGLRGSQDIAGSFKQAKEMVAGVLLLDMTNYKGSANDVALFTDYTDSKRKAFLAQLAAAYLPDLKIGYDKCGYACSDHASWHVLSFPASVPFESSFARDNPAIHAARDTFANPGGQAVHALKFARLAAAFAVELKRVSGWLFRAAEKQKAPPRSLGGALLNN